MWIVDNSERDMTSFGQDSCLGVLRAIAAANLETYYDHALGGAIYIGKAKVIYT